MGWGVSENNTKSCRAGRESQSIGFNFNGFATRSAALTSVEPYATLMGGDDVSDPGVCKTQSRACGVGRQAHRLELCHNLNPCAPRLVAMRKKKDGNTP